MGALVGVLIGLLVGTFGFPVMRNPMRLALLSWQKGYYQRMVLDTTMLIIAIRQLIKGELFNWWRMWKVSAELGRIDVFPPVTLKMQKEARFFTIALFSLALLSVAAALFHRLA